MLRVVIGSPRLSVDVFFDDGKVRLEPTAAGHAESTSIFEQRPFEQAINGRSQQPRRGSKAALN